MRPLTVFIRSHVEIEADDRAVGRLDSGQTVQLLAKRSFERSCAFRSHALRFASSVPAKQKGLGEGDRGEGNGGNGWIRSDHTACGVQRRGEADPESLC